MEVENWKSGKVEKWKIGKWAADLWDGTFNETTGRNGMDSRQARKDGHGLVWSGLVWYGMVWLVSGGTKVRC